MPGPLEPSQPLEIGRSVLGQPLLATVQGRDSAGLRVLVLGGQHGDEPCGAESVRRLAGQCLSGLCGPSAREELLLATVPVMNPDGARSGTRTNAQGIDLNRDHRELGTPEVRAVHAFVDRFRPHLIVDVHDYPPRRHPLVARGWTLDADVQLAIPSHPAGVTVLTETDLRDLLGRVGLDVEREGYSFHEYALVQRSGRARRSTLSTRDARNALTLRYGVPVLLVEGRSPGRHDREGRTERTISSQLSALRSVLRWSLAHRSLLTGEATLPRPGERVAVRLRWTTSGRPLALRVYDQATGTKGTVHWPSFDDGREGVDFVELPVAYAVPQHESEVLDALRGHHWTVWSTRAGAVRASEGVPPSDATRPEIDPNDPKAGRGRRDTMEAGLDSFVVYPTHQVGGRALAVWLERRSAQKLRVLRRRAPSGGASPWPVLRIEVTRRRSPLASEAPPSAPCDATQ